MIIFQSLVSVNDDGSRKELEMLITGPNKIPYEFCKEILVKNNFNELLIAYLFSKEEFDEVIQEIKN